jgi:hypothetical protein
MPTSFTLDGLKIVGWQSGKTVPSGNIEVTDADREAYNAAQATMKLDGRSGERPEWNGNQVVIPPDTRPVIRVESPAPIDPQLGVAVIDADGIDEATITITKLVSQSDPSTDTGFNNTVRLLLNNRLVRFNFTNGIATKVFKSTSFKEFELKSNPRFKVETAFRIMAAE